MSDIRWYPQPAYEYAQTSLHTGYVEYTHTLKVWTWAVRECDKTVHEGRELCCSDAKAVCEFWLLRELARALPMYGAWEKILESDPAIKALSYKWTTDKEPSRFAYHSGAGTMHDHVNPAWISWAIWKIRQLNKQDLLRDTSAPPLVVQKACPLKVCTLNDHWVNLGSRRYPWSFVKWIFNGSKCKLFFCPGPDIIDTDGFCGCVEEPKMGDRLPANLIALCARVNEAMGREGEREWYIVENLDGKGFALMPGSGAGPLAKGMNLKECEGFLFGALHAARATMHNHTTRLNSDTEQP